MPLGEGAATGRGAARSNEEWIAALASDGPGSETARRDLRDLLVSRLRRVVASRGASEDLCEDVAQEALLRVGERLDEFRGQSRFTTWALSIAIRIAFDELRHKRWKDVSFEEITADAHRPLVFESPVDDSQEKKLVRERVLLQLKRVIENELTAKQREALVAELGGMPQAEIADRLGMTRNALYKLSHDARKRVKSHLEAAGLTVSEVLWVFE